MLYLHGLTYTFVNKFSQGKDTCYHYFQLRFSASFTLLNSGSLNYINVLTIFWSFILVTLSFLVCKGDLNYFVRQLWQNKEKKHLIFELLTSKLSFLNVPFQFLDAKINPTDWLRSETALKKWSFLLWLSSVNVTWNYGFGHIYWRNLKWKTSVFVQCDIL